MENPGSIENCNFLSFLNWIAQFYNLLALMGYIFKAVQFPLMLMGVGLTNPPAPLPKSCPQYVLQIESWEAALFLGCWPVFREMLKHSESTKIWELDLIFISSAFLEKLFVSKGSGMLGLLLGMGCTFLPAMSTVPLCFRCQRGRHLHLPPCSEWGVTAVLQ